MNTEEIRKKFEDGAAIPESAAEWREDMQCYNWKTINVRHPLDDQWADFERGYRQAVKDMDINIQPIITAINMLERDGTTVRDEISDELRELVGKIKEFQS